jgi:hypothetical protein
LSLQAHVVHVQVLPSTPPPPPQVAAAASQRSRDAHVTAVAAAFDKCDRFDRNDKLKNDVSDINDFFVFNRTTVADILAAKHSLYTYWGSNHWCDADGEYIFISV